MVVWDRLGQCGSVGRCGADVTWELSVNLLRLILFWFWFGFVGLNPLTGLCGARPKRKLSTM